MIYKYLPYFIFKPLYGDREKWGLKKDVTDKDFILWEEECLKFYNSSQNNKIGKAVYHFGFKIIKEINLTGQNILEIGPGIIEHLDYNNSKPKQYLLADIRENFLTLSKNKLQEVYNIKNVQTIEMKDIFLPLTDNSVDIIITFHQMEHVYDLENYISELKRVLKPNGLLVGAVPTEGGFLWGLGRFLTTRRLVKKQYSFDYDKIICWEHPNFVNRIKKHLDNNFSEIESIKKPFNILPFDLNLSWSFIYQNNKK